MTDITAARPSKPAASPIEPDSEVIIRQLEKYPVEALEAALLILQSLKPNQAGALKRV